MLPKKKQLSGAEKRRKKKESDLKILALKDILDNVDLDCALNDFASRNARRNFFEALKYYCCRWSQSSLVLI